ncbi:MAG: hypothetical protein ACFFD4_25255, partial [Candidatus Odinarchaeota archaeon]
MEIETLLPDLSKLPDISGTKLVGTHIPLPTRATLENNLRDFIDSFHLRKSEGHPTGRIILGEWGDGKTELFDSIIKPYSHDKGDLAVYLSGSTFLNARKLPEVEEIIRKFSLETDKFLVSLIYAIKSHSEIKDIELPEIDVDIGVKNIISSWFDSIFQDLDSDSNFIVFFDEFEELLDEDEGLKAAVKGIRSLISGDVILGEKKKYNSRLHLIIACTPAAFYKLEHKKSIGEIVGGFSSRLRPIEI